MTEPSHRVCKPAYLVPVPSQDKLGGLCELVPGRVSGLKMVGMAEMGAPISLDGVAVGTSACVIFILHQKIQKMAKFTFWYQLTQVVPNKVQRTVQERLANAKVNARQHCVNEMPITDYVLEYNNFSLGDEDTENIASERYENQHLRRPLSCLTPHISEPL